MDAFVPCDLSAAIEPFLPSEPDKSKVDRLSTVDRAAPASIILVLRTRVLEAPVAFQRRLQRQEESATGGQAAGV